MESSGITKDIALLIVGIGFGVLPWLLDKTGIDMPRPIYVLAGCLCILAMWWALAILDLLQQIPQLKNRTVLLSKVFVAVFAVAMLVLWMGKTLFTEPVKLGNIKTELRLQFFGGPRPPTQIYQDNIYAWDALWGPSAAISYLDANKQQLGKNIIIPENWNIFVVFQKPTLYNEVTVSFSSPGFPQYEVKQSTNRSIVVNVSGSIPEGFLEIYVKH